MSERDDAALLKDLLGAVAVRAGEVPAAQLLEAGPHRLRALGLPRPEPVAVSLLPGPGLRVLLPAPNAPSWAAR